MTQIGYHIPLTVKQKKNERYQEIMFSTGKIQLEKVQLTRDLKDDTILYFIKEYAYLVIMTKVIVILPLEPMQP